MVHKKTYHATIADILFYVSSSINGWYTDKYSWRSVRQVNKTGFELLRIRPSSYFCLFSKGHFEIIFMLFLSIKIN